MLYNMHQPLQQQQQQQQPLPQPWQVIALGRCPPRMVSPEPKINKN